MQTLVLYFSVSGNTKQAALTIGQQLNADVAALVPTEGYSTNYDAVVARGEQEKDTNALPAFKPLPVDLDAYQTIYLGFPIWWSLPPRIIATLMQQAALSGKTIVPFATSATSVVAECLPALNEWANAADATVRGGFTANSKRAILAALK